MTPPPTVAGAVRERLLAFLADMDRELPVPLSDETPLVDSGLLDSLAILRLALWVEEEVGPVDPASVNLPAAWNTVGAIVAFVEERRPGNGAGGGSHDD